MSAPPSGRTALLALALAVAWWPITTVDPVAGAYVAGASVTAVAALAVHDHRRPRPPRRRGGGGGGRNPWPGPFAPDPHGVQVPRSRTVADRPDSGVPVVEPAPRDRTLLTVEHLLEEWAEHPAPADTTDGGRLR